MVISLGMVLQTEAEGFEEEWEDSVLTKEELEASIRRKVEATIRRERALAYAYTHQVCLFIYAAKNNFFELSIMLNLQSAYKQLTVTCLSY